jgi:formamidopyrimidine-DNA glycosylase
LPELPDVVVYLEALTRHVVGQRLERVNLLSPFVLRSVDPPVSAVTGRTVRAVRRIGKRIVLSFDSATDAEASQALSRADDLFVVIHLMIAGRLRWREPKQKAGIGPKLILASLVFPNGTLLFTEASSKKRASMLVVRGEDALRALDPGGIEPLDATLERFHDALTRENHTVKRALTDPHLFSGIGNAYSDEILHAARLSPLKLTKSLDDAEVVRLYDAVRATLTLWTDRLREQTGAGFPEKVTAFHGEMAVHGRYKEACRVCGAPVQRIVYADNECNYCARCQTGGKLLADRSLSRLLKSDWPRSIDEIG